MSDEQKEPETKLLPPGQVAVTISVASHGKLEDAEEMARAVVRALKVIVPSAQVGE
jgi:hypothetical protein